MNFIRKSFPRHVLLPSMTVAAIALSPANAIVIRHDIPDAAYLALESDFPAVFSIYRTRAGHKECGATLIAPGWAVTAAHCARDPALLNAVAPGGAGHRVTIGGQDRRIDRILYHPANGADRAPDIALLRLATPVTHVDPIALYRGKDELGRLVVMPGWGGTGNGKGGLGEEDGLFRVAENLIDKVEEAEIWWRFDAPGPGSPALTLEGISGPGDSGGPALVRSASGWAIVGVSSAQDSKGGREGLYGVDEMFVRISYAAGWIDRTIAERR